MRPSANYFNSPRPYRQLADQGIPSSNFTSRQPFGVEYPIVINSEEELDQFLGGLISDVGHAVGSVAKAIDKVVPVSKIAKGVSDVVSAVDKVVPISLMVPGGVLLRFAGDTALRVARGENVLDAIGKAGKGSYDDIRRGVQLASMVAGFVPGIGTGVAAALGAANALMNGQPITDALIASARSAIPGGEIAQTAFDMAVNVAKGQNIGEAALNTVRSKIPGIDNPVVAAAFDTALALSKGQSLQKALLSSAGKLLPQSPYAEGPMAFVNKVIAGHDIQSAALTAAGNVIHRKLQQTGTLSVPGVGSIVLKNPKAALRRPALAIRPPVQRIPLTAFRGIRMSAMPQREVEPTATLSEPSYRSGRWVRQDGRIIIQGI